MKTLLHLEYLQYLDHKSRMRVTHFIMILLYISFPGVLQVKGCIGTNFSSVLKFYPTEVDHLITA